MKIKTLLLALASFFAIDGLSQVEFVPNLGQLYDFDGKVHPEIKYTTELNGSKIYFQENKIFYQFLKTEDKVYSELTEKEREAYDLGNFAEVGKKRFYYQMDLEFINSSQEVEIQKGTETKTARNFYLAHCPDGILGVKATDELVYHNIYQNIDLRFYSVEGQLKYDFILNPGANPKDIQLKYVGFDEINLTEKGIEIKNPMTTFTDSQPVSQTELGVSIPSEFKLDKEAGIFSIEIGREVIDEKIIIDPTIEWTTFFGGSSSATWTRPIFGSDDAMYNTGYTYETTFPVINAGTYFDGTKDGSTDLIIAKFDADHSLYWATYYGGDNSDFVAGYTDYGKAIAINSSDEIYVAGLCNGATNIFPTLDEGGGAWYQTQAKIHGETSFFLKFNSTGVRQWATIFQHTTASTSSEAIRLNGITCDGDKLYFTGQLYNWNGSGIPLQSLPGAYNNSTYVGDQDPFVGRFSSSDALEWNTYLNGGNVANQAYSQGCDLHVDGNGNLYFVGRESSGDPGAHALMNPGGGAYYQSTNAGDQDLIITKFNSNMAMVWSTYYGGDDQDIPSMISTDNNENPLLVCRAVQSTNWPTTDPGGGAFYQNSLGAPGNTDGGILKFDPTGDAVWCTYVGGSGNTNYQTGIGADHNNDIYVFGYSNSADFPTMTEVGSYNDGTLSGTFDATFMRFSNSGVQEWGSFYGGSATETLYNAKGNVHQGNCGSIIATMGFTQSTDINLVNPGGGAYFDNTMGGTSNSFIYYFIDGSASSSTAPTSVSGTSTICSGASTTLTQSGGSLSGSDDYVWYTGSCGGTQVGTGNSISVSPTSNTTYYVRVEGPCGNTACTSVTVTVNPNSTAPTGIIVTSNPICNGGNTDLTVQGGSLGTGGSFEWYTGSCGGTSIGTGTTINVSPSSTTTYFVRAEGTCNTTACASVSVTVNSASTAAASITVSQSTLCDGDDTDLTVSGGSLGTGADWAWYTGSCGGTSVGSGTSINVSPSSTTTYYVRAEGTCNTTACASTTITVNSIPNANITSSSADLCEGETVNLTGTPAGGSWSVTSGPGTIATDVLTSTGAGIINLEYSVTALGCTGTDNQSITVAGASDGSWTSPGTVCESGGTIDLNTLITGDAGGTWSGTGVTGSTFDPSGQNGNTITITYDVGATCPDQVQHDVMVETAVTATWTLPTAMCESESPLDLTPFITGSAGGSWTGTGISGSNFDPSGLVGMNSITYNVGSGSCADMLTQDIEVLASPSTPVFEANDSTICSGATVTLTGSGSGTVDYNIYSDASGTTLLGLAPLDVNPTITTTYYLEAEGTNGCGNIGGLQPLTITVTPLPTLTVSADQNICVGQDVTLQATGSGSLLWSTSETTTEITVSPTTNTTYTVSLTDGNGCTANESVMVTVQSSATVNAMDDFASTLPDALVNIDVASNDDGDASSVAIIENPSNGIASLQSDGSIDYLPLSGYTGSDSITYRICDVFCSTLCDTAIVRIEIQREEEISVPGGFSPNGDGTNEFFVIEGLDAFPDNTLTIFNRWGDIVYTASPYANDWGGQAEGKRTISGDAVVTGTYFYILEFGEDIEPLHGSIEIKK